MRQIIIKEPVRVSELRPDIPGDLDKLLMQMMNKEPGERPSAKSIQDKLQYLREKKREKVTGNNSGKHIREICRRWFLLDAEFFFKLKNFICS